jgi:hypothetical protein
MWTVIALFCNLTDPNKGYCVPVVPPLIFQTYEDCQEFASAGANSIDLAVVSYDYQCVSWLPKI